MNNNQIYIGIDDTDNLETRGTGFRARQLVWYLQANKLATGIAITRHQLLVDDRIPYTSHNSSACIAVEPLDNIQIDQLMDSARSFMLEIAAEGSDVGLCLATPAQAAEVVRFGQMAKIEVVQQQEALELAKQHSIRLEGLTGTHQGIIGSLSAVGLHVYGNDGRYIWVKGIRELAGQILSMHDLIRNTGIEKVSLLEGKEIRNASAEIDLGLWPRPVRIDSFAVLLVEQQNEHHKYKVLEKDIIKSVRP